MTAPVATYRLQFRNGMDFARAASLASYFARLGVSHLYASPLFAAAKNSAHGYDAIDVTEMEPAIGGDAGFDKLCAALDTAGLGLLLDFVPNHMAAHEDNGWWRSVLEWGAASPSAAIFDIDWSAPELILPILGTPYEACLRDKMLGIAFDAGSGSFEFTCYDRQLPLTPPSYEVVLSRASDPELSGLAREFASTTADRADALKQRLAAFAAQPAGATEIAALVANAKDDPALLDRIHDAQIWQLVPWRQAREVLSYRRFFEIAGLVCLRVEEPAVFDAVHARLFMLIAAGRIAGVRLDHIDGLADPAAYLKRFRQAVGGDEPYYLLVEKILEPGEGLRPDWPVAGTTGYEFIAALAGLFVDRQRKDAMSRAYEGFAGPQPAYEVAVRSAKREILTYNLAAELAILTERARAIAANNPRTRHLDADALRRAIVEITAALPVYRSYVGANGPDATDRALVAGAASDAKASVSDKDDPAAVDFIARLVLLEDAVPAVRDAALAFATRFQQTTGPVMAKAVEDTMFYRYGRLIALNEVGGDADRFGAPLSDFHAVMAERLETQPAGLSATATHDTKRGEDARARLYVLSETADAWAEAVRRWAALNAPWRIELADGPAPDPATEWLFYQALAGAWPAGLAPDDAAGLETLRARMGGFMEKAIREAKTRTSWTDPDAAYEGAVAQFVAAVLSPETGGVFLADFARTCQPVWLAGAVTGLAQLAVKLAAPGAPDLYQGTELWDFSLVDPDNRRPVDFDARQRMLGAVTDAEPEGLLDDWISGAPKMALTAAGLRMRAARPALFADGSYTALAASGTCARHIVAFTRTLDDGFAIAIAPRLVLPLTEGANRPLIPAERWADTAIALPPPLRGRPMRDVLTGAVHDGGEALSVARVLARFPAALLVDAA